MDELYVFSGLVGLLVLIGVNIFLWYLRRNDDYWEKRGVPYDPRPSFFAIFKALSDKTIAEITLDNARKMGKMRGQFEFCEPTLQIIDPELLKDILVKDFHVFNMRREMKFGEEILDNMVGMLKDEDWKRVRTILTPVFTTRRLKIMISIINECSQSVVNAFEKRQEKGGVVDMKRIFGAFTLDVIARAAFATKINSIEDPENIFLKKAKDFFGNFSLRSVLINFLLPKWLSSRINITNIRAISFFKEVILNVIEERKSKGQRYNDMLQLLMDATDEHFKDVEKSEDEADQYGSIIHKETNHDIKYKRISKEELLAQCVTFFSVGYETTASTMSYMAYCLATNPECQEKLVEEVDKVFESHNEVNYDVIRDMKYLDSVLSETLRMYAPLVMIERTAGEDYKLADTGLTIEKGVRVSIPVYGMHFDPQHFPEPEKFKPERFLQPTHHPYAYLPFGAGPRNCLGMRFALMEIKICIANIVRHYRFRVAETTKVPLEFIKGGGFLQVNELPLKIEKRTDIKI